ncbi:MAG: hypothetical protein JO058_02765 [Alphaproteobacteria bacterium]|nr:hypothetical protein [Alphaproteobacteria bacterium]MBV9150527.1 hypothetical protein [Alphaproteobacteria bacterium]
MTEAPITELVLSPRWTTTVGDIDGTPHVVLRIQHPRLGPLDFLLPDNDAVELAAALEKTWERRDERRLRLTATRLEPTASGRPSHAPTWWSRLVRTDPRVTTKIVVSQPPAGDKKSRDAG